MIGGRRAGSGAGVDRETAGEQRMRRRQAAVVAQKRIEQRRDILEIARDPAAAARRIADQVTAGAGHGAAEIGCAKCKVAGDDGIFERGGTAGGKNAAAAEQCGIVGDGHAGHRHGAGVDEDAAAVLRG